MDQQVRLPYFSRYFPGSEMKLGWLKAVTTNDYRSARFLNWHAHDELEIIFPLRGHYRYEFSGKKTEFIDNESFIIIPGGTSHRLSEAIDPPGGRMHLYLRNPSERSIANDTFTKQEYANLYQRLSGLPQCALPVSPLLKASVASLGKIVTQSQMPLSDADRLKVRFLCCLILCHCTSSGVPVPVKSPSQIFDEAVNWLKLNYSTVVHIDELIDHIGYSRSRFFDLFKQQTNMTPSDYLRNIRLEKAKEMLSQTNLPASSIGKACGFGDPAHFSRLFRKMTGYTPLAYRNRSEGCQMSNQNKTTKRRKKKCSMRGGK